MAETELSIALKVVDEATEPIKTAITGVKQETERLKTTTEQAGKTIKEQFKEASNSLRDFRRTIFLATAALATVISSVREASKYNKEAKDTFDGFTTAISSLATTVGVALVPALKGVTVIVNALRDTLSAAIAGFIKLFSFITEFFTSVGQEFSKFKVDIKTMLLGPDPFAVGEAMKRSWQRALEVSDIATDEFLNKVETTRAKVEGGAKVEEDLGRIRVVKEKLDTSAEDWKKYKDRIQENLKQIKFSFIDNFGQAFANVLVEGQKFGDAMKALFKDLIKVIIAELAKLAAIRLVRFLLAKFHDGGVVEAPQEMHTGGFIKAHQGLAVDEVPIIAQTGEGILSRRGMQSLGGEGALNRLNQGKGSGGGGDINVNIYYPKMTSREEVKQMADVLGGEIDRQLRYARSV